VSPPGSFKMATIAERTGFSPALLRAWERRHGLLVPDRTLGGHRLYTEDDLAVLRRVRELLDLGRTIGEIAAIGRGALLSGAPRGSAPAAPREPARGLVPQRDQLVAAAEALDARGVDRALDEAFAMASPSSALEQVVEPALIEIGELWAGGRVTVASEHLVVSKVVARLSQLITVATPADAGAEVAVVACLPGEQHEIGAMFAAYALARRGLRVAYLGGSLPLEDLEGACRRLKPAILCLSVTRQALLTTHEPELIAMAQRLARPRIVLGGQGVGAERPLLIAAGVELVAPGTTIDAVLDAPRRGPGRRRR
jgi:DNA-binding transcriptional MerR regulator